MDRTDIKIHLAVPMPSNEIFESEKYKSRTVLYETIDELCSLSGKLEFNLFENGMHFPEIALADDSTRDELKTIISKKNVKNFDQSEILTVSGSILFSNEMMESVSKQINEEDKHFSPEAVTTVLIRKYFLKRVFNLLVMANICKVGSIEIIDSLTVQNGVNIGYNNIPKMDSWALQRAVTFSEKTGWPKLQKLCFAQAWQWSIEHDFISDEFIGNNSTERALTAFSRLFELASSDEPMQLIWALIGIEALYINGKTAIIEQVKEKSQIFLGRFEAYKKKINEMYNFRSRFIHGDLNFPSLYLITDASREDRKFDKGLLEAIEIATAVLTATLQQIIKNNWSGLAFSYQAYDPNQKKS